MNIASIPRFLLLEVVTPQTHRDSAINNFAELESLVATFGGIVVDRAVQHRVKPHPATYIGSGKIETIKEIIDRENIDIVVLNAAVNAGQIYRLEKALWQVNINIAVWDKVDLLLHIFDKHAVSTEAKLQIELAYLQHLGPRIYGLGGTLLSRQAGGIGTRGIGETNIEIMKRHYKDRIRKIRRELDKLALSREESIRLRSMNGTTTIALVGYTNAGKTSLFNILTGKDKLVHNSLFTTLDSVVGRLNRKAAITPVLISDTIGFIDSLPLNLLDAFRSTLMESVNSQLLLHVIDAADVEIDKKIRAVENILMDLDIHNKEKIIIFNKLDKIDISKKEALTQKYMQLSPLFISTKTGQGLEVLMDLLKKRQ